MLRVIFIATLAATVHGVVQHSGKITNIDTGAIYQASELAIAINNAQPGETLQLSAGVFSGSGNGLTPGDITIEGAGQGQTIIDVTDYNGLAIRLSTAQIWSRDEWNNTDFKRGCATLRGFTLQGPAKTDKHYGIKSNPGCLGIVIEDVTVQDMSKSNIDLNGAENTTLTNIISTGSTAGFGLSLPSPVNVEVTNIRTANNAWGGIAMFPARVQYQTLPTGNGGPSGIVFTDLKPSDIQENGLVLVQQGEAAYNQYLRTSPDNPSSSGQFWEEEVCNPGMQTKSKSDCNIYVPEEFAAVATYVRNKGDGKFNAIGTQENVKEMLEGLNSDAFKQIFPSAVVPAEDEVVFVKETWGSFTWNRRFGCCREDGLSHHSSLLSTSFTREKVSPKTAYEDCETRCSDTFECTAFEVQSSGKKKTKKKKKDTRKSKCELHSANINAVTRRSKSCKKSTCTLKDWGGGKTAYMAPTAAPVPGPTPMVSPTSAPTAVPTPAPAWTEKKGCCRQVDGKIKYSHHDTATTTIISATSFSAAAVECKEQCNDNENCTAAEVRQQRKKGTTVYKCELHSDTINSSTRGSKSCKKATCLIKN